MRERERYISYRDPVATIYRIYSKAHTQINKKNYPLMHCDPMNNGNVVNLMVRVGSRYF